MPLLAMLLLGLSVSMVAVFAVTLMRNNPPARYPSGFWHLRAFPRAERHSQGVADAVSEARRLMDH